MEGTVGEEPSSPKKRRKGKHDDIDEESSGGGHTEVSADHASNPDLGKTQGYSTTITGISGGHAENCTIIGVSNTCNCGYAALKTLQVSEDDLKRETEGMIKVSAVDTVVKKLKEGQHWVTITGNAGDGKSTVGYLVLHTFKNKDAYMVTTPEELSDVSKLKTDCIVLLDDIFGMFTLDKAAFDKCLPQLKRILQAQEKPNEKDKSCFLLTSRWNVLLSAKDYLGQWVKILDEEHVVNVGAMKVEKERLSILNYHLERKGITVSDYVKQRVVTHHAPHGFAHCCKMYADLQKDSDIDIEDFFQTPLKFLHLTTKVLLKEESYSDLFKRMIKDEGVFNVYGIKDSKERKALTIASKELAGSYIQNLSGRIHFTHPSVYESVLISIGEDDILFIIEHASLSVFCQMGHIKKCDEDEPDHLNIDPVVELLDPLSKRFCKEILERNFSVFQHEFCDNQDFCHSLLKNCVDTDPTSNKVTVGINDKDSMGCTMLWTAMKSGRYAAVHALVEHGADVDLVDEEGYGQTPLRYLCEGDEPDVSTIQLLVEHHADVNLKETFGQTPLHCLCATGKPDVSTMQLLVEHHADVNLTETLGRTPLHYLCGYSEADVSAIQFLVEHHADVNLTDRHGQTPLHWQCSNGNPDVSTMQLLVNHHANVNLTDRHGQTPLHYLCVTGKADVSTIQLLVNHHANVNLTDEDGKTPLHYLCRRDEPDVSTIQLLIEHGADVNIMDTEKRSPLDYLPMEVTMLLRC